MIVLAADQCYYCAECLEALLFETVPERWAAHGRQGSQLDARGFAVATCTTAACERRGVRLKVKLTQIECEELPPLEENPHATQNPNPAGAERLLRGTADG